MAGASAQSADHMSYADEVFKKNIQDILDHGVSDASMNVRPHWEDGTPAHTISLFGVVNRYDLSKEVPIITLRRTYWKTALKEILWIWQKKSNNVHDLDGHIWDEWADETGSIGKAYGYQLGKKYPFPEGTCDQVDHVLWQLKNDPASRRIMTNLYNFEDLHEMHLAPCAYSVTFSVKNGKLNMILNQRSQDMVAASAFNTFQYACLNYMFCAVTGLEPGEFIHVIADCHIYDRHIELAKEIIANPSFEAPKLLLNPEVKDFYDFTPADFTMEGYQYGPFDKKIPIAI